MTTRSIRSRARHGSLQLMECLRSLLALELMSSSENIYLISPWITDITIINDPAGKFRSLMPEQGRRLLRLSEVLGTLADRGGEVRIITRPGQSSNDEFLRRLPAIVPVRFDRHLHQKALISNTFYLHGSMNFTYSGVRINEESVEISSDPEDIALALLEAFHTWQSLSP